MGLNFSSRIKNAWNAFTNKHVEYDNSYGTFSKPDRVILSRRNEKTIVTSILNRISLDVASIDFRHCKLDENDRFLEYMNTPLDSCLQLDANIDQTSKTFIQDVVLSMFDEGCVAIVPIDTNHSIYTSESFDIYTMRTGKITTWYPDKVKINVYNDKTGKREELVLPKTKVAIIENPFYSVMNEYNSTLQRLIRKLNLLDAVDEQSSSGKLDLLVQLPYVIKSQTRKDQAEVRRHEIENQLKNSKYGIAYIDGTEKVTQLNRPIENNLMKQIEYLTSMLYSQLGMTQAVLDGTADEKVMRNYYSRIIEPICNAIANELKRKFLTKTARAQKQTILFFRDPFKLVPVSQLADIADKFTRNEIMTSNEIRQVIGQKPSSDPKADELLNSNLNHPEMYPEGPEDNPYNEYNEGGGYPNEYE